MRRFSRKQPIWVLGIDAEQEEAIQAFAGDQYAVVRWSDGNLPEPSSPELGTAPCLLCFSLEACREFMAMPLTRRGYLEMTPKALLLPPDADLPAMEEAISFGVSDIIKTPLADSALTRCLRKAAEAAALQRDIQNMAHEVFLERELLERKNEALSFLVNFLSGISDSFNEEEVLTRSFTCLQTLFPVQTLHGAIFSKDDDGEFSVDLFIAAPEETPAYAEWRARLLTFGAELVPMDTVRQRSVPLLLPPSACVTARPTDGHILTLPVHLGVSIHMVLLVQTTLQRNLTKDQTIALDSALRHMAISIKNVRRYQRACHFADRDSLTGSYNRRFFEERLLAEIARHQRYGEDLSLLMLDIDHFKAINDTYGHLKGDEVLRAIVKTILVTIRQTDACCRYGGEEFMVLLPHTSPRNAAWLAERLRRKIQKLSFRNGETPFSITASIGVSCLRAGDACEGANLTHEADLALYKAKDSGRNKVVVYEKPERQKSRFSIR